MTLQNVDRYRRQVSEAFAQLGGEQPERLARPLDLSWSNWGFGIEDFGCRPLGLRRRACRTSSSTAIIKGPTSATRWLRRGGSSGTTASPCPACAACSRTTTTSPATDPIQQQEALAYIRREIALTRDVGGTYRLVVPASVGRTVAYDTSEFFRSVEALRLVADEFAQAGAKAAIEPIRAAETTLVHTVTQAVEYIDAVDGPGVQHINGDVYHMQVEEVNVPLAILRAGDRFVNLHMADSNRTALGHGSMDRDTIVQALYLIGHNTPGRFVTPEPLGPGGAPYPARYGRLAAKALDELVFDTVSYFREREEVVRAG